MLYVSIARSKVDANPDYKKAYDLMLEGFTYLQIGEAIEKSALTASRYVRAYETHYGNVYIYRCTSAFIKTNGEPLIIRRAFRAANDKRATLLRRVFVPTVRKEIIIEKATPDSIEKLYRFASHYEHFMFTPTGDPIHKRRFNAIERRQQRQLQNSKKIECPQCHNRFWPGI